MKPLKELLNFGILNIDKPSGPTSFWVSDFIRKELGLKKTSHFGTLDPKVTGVLPIALGRACKIQKYFLKKEKVYVGIMRIHEEISLSDLQKEMDKFVGKIMQLPPVKSRVKREIREREVFEFKIIEKNGKDVLFFSKVEAGTYIRKLLHDLGLKIGGAHMLELRRTQASIFSEEDKEFMNLYDFEKAVESEEELRKMIIPGEEAIKKALPVVQIKEESLYEVLNGKPLRKEDIVGKLPKENVFAVFLKDRFLEVAKKTEEEGIVARAEFVFN